MLARAPGVGSPIPVRLRGLSSKLSALLTATCLLAACGASGDSSESVPVNSLPAVSTTRADGTAQTPRGDVDAFVQQQLVALKIPGATLVVMHDGQLVYAKGYGYADLTARTPARPEQRVDIGSITKQFVAAAVLLLNEEGRIDLDEKISTYLGPEGPAQWGEITVRQVLSHTAGLAGLPDDDFFKHIDDAGATTEASMLAKFRTYPLSFTPGSSWAYSNVGYDLLGFIVSRITGHFYGDYIQQRIFTPLGMSTARFIHASNSWADTLLPYDIDNKGWTVFELSDGVREYLSTGASGIQLSALDMAKWDAALAQGTVLSPASQALMWTPAGHLPRDAYDLGMDYGFGWFLADLPNGHHAVSHSGGMPGFTTEFVRYLDSGWSVAVFTNIDERYGDPLSIATGVASLFSDNL